MPTSNTQSRTKGRDQDKNRRERIMKKASSFHGQTTVLPPVEPKQLRRLRTLPDLVPGGGSLVGTTALVVREVQQKPRLTKLLLKVTMRGSVGAMQVVVKPDSTVEDLISTAVREYVKEGRRPILQTADPSCYGLHYSPFSLESLNREEKLIELGSRNFFICPKKSVTVSVVDKSDSGNIAATSPSTCSRQAEAALGSCFDWLKLMDFLL